VALNALPVIVTCTSSVFEHPVVDSVAVNTKVVFDVKLTVVGSSTMASKSDDAGVQLYVSAPVTVALSVVLVPLGIDISSPAFTTGKAFTVTVIVAVVAHSPAVGVNVYTVGPVIVVFIVAGDQVPVIPLFDVVGNIPGVTPEQYGPNCVKVGVTLVLTVTVTDPATLVQPLTVAVTLYCPAAAVVTSAIVGFCNVDVNPFGPVQLYVAPLIVDAVRFSVDPAQTGLLLPAVGAAGIALTVTVTCELTVEYPSSTST